MLLIDDHDVSRAACWALLRTEGVDVVADLPVCDDALAAAARLCPNAAIIDIKPEDEHALVLAQRLRTLPHPPTVVFTSSDPGAALDTKHDGFPSISKADLCRSEILAAIRVRQADYGNPVD